MKTKTVFQMAMSVALLACTAAFAADSEVKTKSENAGRTAGVATFGQLDELRSQNAMLEASIKNAELRSKLAGGKSSAVPAQGPAALLSPAPTQPASAPSAAMVETSGTLSSVSAEVVMVASDADGRLVAVLALQNGRKVKARVGMDIPGVGVIKTITIDEVVAVGKKGKLVGVPFASEPTISFGAGATPSQPMPGLQSVMPPIPGMMRGGR